VTANGELRGDWEVARIDEVAQVNPRREATDYQDDLSVTFVPMAAVAEDYGGIDTSILRPYGEVKMGYTQFKDGDVLFAKITPCMENGKVAVVRGIAGEHGYGSTEFHVLRPFSGVEASWIASYISQKTFRSAARQNMTGSAGQLRVPKPWLAEQPVPLASTQEQKRIIAKIEELLSDLDAGVASLERVKANLARYKASILKAAVEGRLTEQWREEHPDVESASVLLERIRGERRARWEEEQLAKYETKGQKPPKGWREKYKEPLGPDLAELPALPDGWSWATLDQLVDSASNGFGKRRQDLGEPAVVLRLADIAGGDVSFDDVRTINATNDEVIRYCLQPDDLLVIRVNGSPDLVGRMVHYFDQQHKNVLYCDHFIRLRLKMGVVARWIRLWSDSEQAREYVDSHKVCSAGQNTISQGSLGRMHVPLPPQEEMAIVLELMDSFGANTQAVSVTLKHTILRSGCLHQSILARAFSGKLVPQDPADEPASVLLDRIRAEREAEVRKKPARGRRASKKSTGQQESFSFSASTISNQE